MDLAAHEELVRLAERRRNRAWEKYQAAQREYDEADTAFLMARDARDECIANNPDDQLIML